MLSPSRRLSSNQCRVFASSKKNSFVQGTLIRSKGLRCITALCNATGDNKKKKKRNPQGQFGRTAQTTRRLMSESKQIMSRREKEKRRQSQFHVNRRPPVLSVVHSKKRSTTRDATIDKPSQGCRQAKPLLTPRSEQNVKCWGHRHDDSS